LVISSGSTPQAMALARQSGAHHVFDYKRDDIAAEIARLTGGLGADLVSDATYSEAGFIETAKTVRRGGSWGVLGVGPGKTTRGVETDSPVDSILAERGAKGSVATLQSRRDRLARCSFWTLRFAVYSNGVNLSRRSFCWPWDGTCAFPSHTATSRSCSPSGVCTPIMSPSGGGCRVTPPKWNAVCARSSNRPTTAGGWMRPTSGSRASGCIYTARWIPQGRPSTSFFRPGATP